MKKDSSMKQKLIAFSFLFLFLCMLRFPAETFTGAKTGLLLWFQTILPTLLPFVIVSNILVTTNAFRYLSDITAPFFKRIFHVSHASCYAILAGFFCGYPMGAKVIADLVSKKCITKKEGQYLLSFCNNTSPMFFINYVILQSLKQKSLLTSSFLVYFFTPILCSFFFYAYYRKEYTLFDKVSDTQIHFSFTDMDAAIMNGFDTITRVGGYMILFSVLINLCNQTGNPVLLASLEITNGIQILVQSSLPSSIVYVLVLALTSFGGWCSIAQTYSMIDGTGLSIIPYITQKLITAGVTSLFAFCFILHQ